MGLDPQDPAVCAHDSRAMFLPTRGKDPCPRPERLGTPSEQTAQQCHSQGDTVCLLEAIREGQGFEPGDRGVLVGGLQGGRERVRLLSPRGCPVGEHDAIRLLSSSSCASGLCNAGSSKQVASAQRKCSFRNGEGGRFASTSGQHWQHLSVFENEKSMPRSLSLGAAPAPFKDVIHWEAVT